jgi:hypothetical protein
VKLAALALAALPLAVACRTLQPGTPLPPDDPRPAALLADLNQRSLGRRALGAEVRVSVDADDVRLRGTQRLLLVRPAQIRVEVMGLFGQVQAVLVSEGGWYQFLDTSDQSVDSGPVTDDLLWRLASIDLTLEDAVDVLLGAPSLPLALGRQSSELFPDGRIGVELRDQAGLARRFVFDAEGRLREAERHDARGSPVWRARFEDYRALPGGAFAFDVELDFPRTGSSARFAFKRVELDPQLPDDAFRLKLPSGVFSPAGPTGPTGGEPR